MIIYIKEWIDNLNIRKTAASWLKKGLVSEEENKEIVSKYPTEYNPYGFFARIGMYIFATIIILCAVGLFLLFAHSDGQSTITVEMIFWAICSYVAAELFVKGKNHFRSGIVDALLYATLTFLGIFLSIVLSGDNFNFEFDPLLYLILFFPFVLVLAIRYADAFLTLVAYAVAILINALIILKFHTVGKMILPFECMAVSYGVYYWIKKQQIKSGFRFWSNCMWIMELASIVTFYLSGNYLVVRKLSEALLNTDIEPGQDINLSYFFYAYTLLVPAAYVWLGLKRKDRLFVRMGVLAIAAGILSIRYYHSFMPIETALILSGIVLIGIAWLSINYLKVPRNGITSAADENTSRLDKISNVAFAELVAQNQAPTPPSSNVDFGGGGFGGGGAGADF